MRKRLYTIKKRLKELDIGGVLILSMDNIRYISEFTGSDGALIITCNNQYLLLDSRYITQAKIEVDGFIIKRYRDKFDGIAKLINRLNIFRLGFESQNITLNSYNKLKDLLKDIDFVSFDDEVEKLRAKKDENELNIMMEAINIAEKSFIETQKKIGRLKIEKDISIDLECNIKKNGGDGIPFDIIVASGERAALPHGRASEKKIKEGEFVIIDFGVNKNGYNSDETVTLIIGEPSQKHKEIYNIVKEAHDEGIAMVKAGVRFSQIDKCIRDRIKKMGYGRYFSHGTGHGIGLSVHERPYVTIKNKDVIEEGMVFTIEPGIYIPNFSGVRIEDMVLATKTGSKTLTSLSKELISL